MVNDKILIITANMRYPLDEAGTIQAYRYINNIKENKILLNWAKNKKKLKFHCVKYKQINSYDFFICKYLSYLLFVLWSLYLAIVIRPKKIYFFPLGYSSVLQQIHALLIKFVSKDFIEILYQTKSPSYLFRFFSRFKIGLVSKSKQRIFNKIGLKTEYIPIIIKKPKKNYSKNQLRKKYGFDKNDFIVLHIGHEEKGRGLELIERLAKDNKNIIFLIKTTSRHQKVQYTKNNFRIISGFIEDIFELYAISDIYIFPLTSSKSVIDVPLTLYEAKMMKIPIICSNTINVKAEFENYGEIYYFDINQNVNKELNIIINKIRQNI